MLNTALKKSEQQKDFPWLSSYAEGVEWEIDIPEQPLFYFLDDAAYKYPDRPAIKFAGHVYDYKTLSSLVDRAARGLQVLGAGRGIKVGLFLPNSAASVVMYYAALKAGATVVNYNPAYIERDLIHQVEDSETDIIVTLDLPPLLEKSFSLLDKTRIKKMIVCPARQNLADPDAPKAQGNVVYFRDLIANDGNPDVTDIASAQDIAVLQYTGGTTGTPKGAALTHRNLVANAAQLARWFHVAEEGKDSMIVVLPLFHVFAMTAAMNMPVMKGMTMLILPQFSAAEILTFIRDEKPAFMAGVPTMYMALAGDSRSAETDFSCLKFCLSGGAPLPADVRRVFEARTRARLVAEGYGLTEFSPVATCNPLTKNARAGSIGLPVPGTLVEIVSLQDGKTPLPSGQKGEVVVSGPQMMKGYYKKPEATAEVVRNGRLHTGDVGYMDDEGFVYIVDRVKDMVLVGGYNVYPRRIEEIIYTHPAVEECIVAGVPDKLRGEAVQAWVKRRSGHHLEADELRAWLQDKLSPVELPKRVIVRDLPLPKTAVGKLSKKDLLAEEGIVRGK